MTTSTGIILSILTPSVPSRLNNGTLGALCAQIERQIGELPVEHLVLIDNKRRTIGEKRDTLLRDARGQYVAFVDDDDWVSDDYVASLLVAIGDLPSAIDVVTFLQGANVNDKIAIIEFKLGNPNEPFIGGSPPTIPQVKRNAWHVCAWRRSLAIQSSFPASNYGEDWAFAAPLCAIPNLKSVHIPKILHHYRHDEKTTEAPPPQPS